MKQKKLASLIAVTLSFEMMVSPLMPIAMAQTTTTTPPAATATPPKSSSADTANAIGSTISAIGQIYNEVRGQQPMFNPQLTGDMALLQQQQTPGPDKYFNAQKLMQLPGLANYLALNNINPAMLDCKTLPTTLHDAKPEVCRVGITGDKGVPQGQMQQMFTYYNQYFQVSKLYKNFSADSNTDGQAFGVGCMNNAMNILNGFFKYRVDELDKLTTNLEAMQDQFKKASRADLDAIEEATAVLDGESELADKVRSRNPDLFDFGKRFNNPACSSMFAGDKINGLGRDGGLNGINADLKKTLSAKTGKYSGESYSKSHTAVMEDLESLADKVSKQLELNFSSLSQNPESYGKFLQDLPELVSSPNGTNRALSPDLFSDVRTKFNDSFLKLREQRSTIESELRAANVPGDAATRLLGNASSSNFESEVASIENGLKNKCFQDALSSMDKKKILDKIYDPTASSHANKFSSNFLKDKLNQILDDSNSSLEKKLADLKSLETNTSGRYYLKMENSYEVQDLDTQGNVKTSVVGASTVRSPSVFFSDLIRNCNAQFKANKLDNKMTGASAIQKLRQLNTDYKNLSASQSLDMKREVRKKLIECSSPEEANNTSPGSCTPDRFNTSAPGFCANAALSCSKNMQACAQQAEGFVTEIKGQRTARVNNYKALVQKNKMDVIKMFDTALAGYMKDGEMLRGMFGAGFSSPAGIKREVEEGSKYLADFQQATGKSPDGRLLLEDPEQYTKMFKENIALLKDSVKKQQDQILGGDATGQGARTPGLLAQHIKKTQDNYKVVITESEQIANMCLQKHDGAIAAAEQQRQKQQDEFQKKMTELGEKRNNFCQMYGTAKQNTKGPCTENIKDIVDTGYQGISSMQNPQQRAASVSNINDLARYCADRSPEPDKSSVSAGKLCQDANEAQPIYIKDPSLKGTIAQACRDRETFLAGGSNCKTSSGSSSTTNGTTQISNSCTDSYNQKTKEIEEKFAYYQARTAGSSSVELEEAPAYCSAGVDTPDRLAKAIGDTINGTQQIIQAGKQ